MRPHRRRVGDIATLEIYILLAVAPAGGGRLECYPSRTGRYSHSGDIFWLLLQQDMGIYAHKKENVTPAGRDDAAASEIYLWPLPPGPAVAESLLPVH